MDFAAELPHASQRVEVGHKIVELLLAESAAGRGHHVAAVQNGLADEALVGGQAAWQKRFLEKAFQAGAVLTRDGVCVVAGRAGLLIDVASAGLLRVQTQLRVGL